MAAETFHVCTENIYDVIDSWLNYGAKEIAPVSTTDLFQEHVRDILQLIQYEATVNTTHDDACYGLVEEMRIEESAERDGTLDCIKTPEDCAALPSHGDCDLAQERAILEEIPLPGYPQDEAARRKEWLKYPRNCRAAIRRMHTRFGHCRNEVLREILKGAKADPRLIAATRYLRCEDCSRVETKPHQTNKVTVPKPYEFNNVVGIDINYINDAEGTLFQFLNVVCCGTDYQIEIPVR